MTTAERVYRSVSQYNQYARCPMSYRLSRIDKVWQRPAAWLPQGSAVHEALEAWEKSDRTMTLAEAQDVFREAYSRHCEVSSDVTPNMEYWFASGPYKGPQDIERRYLIGLEQVEKYLAWALKHPEEKVWATPDGTPAIELPFEFELDGVWIRGFIDLVVSIDGELTLRVRDHKTGNKPGDDFQLGVYGLAISELFGAEAGAGDYYMARAGKPTYPFDLTEWTRERISEKFQELEANIQAENFPPDPSPDKCGFCDVALACEFRA